MIDHASILTDLDALRSIALKNHDDQVALLCLAAKAMLHHCQRVDGVKADAMTRLLQIKSALTVPAGTTAKDLRRLHQVARGMIDELLGELINGTDEQVTQPVEAHDEKSFSL
jgi:hypothetical protein